MAEHNIDIQNTKKGVSYRNDFDQAQRNIFAISFFYIYQTNGIIQDCAENGLFCLVDELL